MAHELPPGAKRVHFGPHTNALAPRGAVQKESLSGVIFEALQAAYDHYTDPVYSDNPDRGELVRSLGAQFEAECQAAWIAFDEYVGRVK
jgi:hypothetical protein